MKIHKIFIVGENSNTPIFRLLKDLEESKEIYVNKDSI